MLQKLNISFLVHDDLTSERKAEYRELVMFTLNFYMLNANVPENEKKMISAMLDDWAKA